MAGSRRQAGPGIDGHAFRGYASFVRVSHHRFGFVVGEGVIAAGLDADLFVLDENDEVACTLVCGRLVHHTDDRAGR